MSIIAKPILRQLSCILRHDRYPSVYVWGHWEYEIRDGKVVYLQWKTLKSYLKANYKAGVLFRLQSFWIGLHYSEYCKRYCLNILPCVTIWWTQKGGQAPRKTL